MYVSVPSRNIISLRKFCPMTQMHTNACEMERESFVLIALSAFVPFCLLTHLFVHSLDKYIKRILYCQSCPRCEQYG
jgi:hypothetical protein